MAEELKRFDLTASGRSSILKGAKYARGFIIRPEQILALIHDTHPEFPLPADAQFQGFGADSNGVDSEIQFYFTSVSAPTEHCLALKPRLFFSLLVDLACGLLPLDAELDGIEISKRFTLILLRVKSSHWPSAPGVDIPLYHLRYEYGRLLLLDPSKSIENERRIQVQ